ncbi:MAG: site-specific integrase, partial [Flavobacteriaceae bacterium]|nr:site-specific integrase [Flavobacteriaceae bacterium]
MKNTFSVLFYPKKKNVNNAGETLLYMRITINGKRTEISTHRKVVLDKWDSKAGKLRGIKSEIREFNNYLDFLRAKVYKAYKRLEEEGS